MEMLVDEVLRSIFAHNNINIRIPVWKHNLPEEFHHVWPAPVNFVHPESPSVDTPRAALLKITEQETKPG